MTCLAVFFLWAESKTYNWLLMSGGRRDLVWTVWYASKDSLCLDDEAVHSGDDTDEDIDTRTVP